MTSILTTTSNFQVEGNPALATLEAQGYRIITNPLGHRLTEAEVMELLAKYRPVGMIAGVEPLTRSVLESATHLKVIARCGIGMDSVDLEAARELGICVSNTPDAPSKAVAELTIGLILSALRNIAVADRTMRAGKWQQRMGHLLSGKTLGILGYGRIGRRVADLASSFGATIIAHDPFLDEAKAACPLLSLDEVLQQADIISLHLPGGDSTHHLIDSSALEKMKRTAILINVGRGGLVDESALATALRNERIAGAALDVYEQEPYDGELVELDNVVLTSHMGSYAKETRMIMEHEAAANLARDLQLSI